MFTTFLILISSYFRLLLIYYTFYIYFPLSFQFLFEIKKLTPFSNLRTSLDYTLVIEIKYVKLKFLSELKTYKLI